MRMILGAVFLVANLTAATTYAQAEVPYLGTPEKLLNQAQKGRKELLDVLLKMKDNVRELRDQQTFDNFFVLLNDFEVLAKDFQLDLIYPQAVAEVGKSMIMHGNRWLRVGSDTTDKILSYQKWADLTAALQFQIQVIEELNRMRNESLFKPAFINLLALENWASARFPEDLYLVPTYQKTIADLSFKALVATEVQNEKEWTFWIQGISTQSAAQDYISFLNEKILAEDIDQNQSLSWMKLNLQLGQQLTKIPRLSGSVRNNYGVLVTDTYSKILFKELTIDPTHFEKTLALLDVSSVRGLAFRWINPEKSYSDSYAIQLVQLSELLLNRAKELKLGQTVLEIEKFVSARLSPVLASQGGIEGTYKLTNKDGKVWFFTLIRETESRVISALCDEEGNICYAFFNMQYSATRKIFLATENTSDDEQFQNTPVQIRFSDSDQVRLDLPYAYRMGTVLRGKKVESHRDLMSSMDLDAVSAEGHYKGFVYLKSGPLDFDLIITANGETSIGRLDSEKSFIRIDLGKGTDGQTGFIYLTSGRTNKGSWFHLRLKQNGYEKLEGVAIVGGVGEVGKAIFTKNYDHVED